MNYIDKNKKVLENFVFGKGELYYKNVLKEKEEVEALISSREVRETVIF